MTVPEINEEPDRLFKDHSFVLALAAIRRRVVQIEAMRKSDLMRLRGLVAGPAATGFRVGSIRFFQILTLYWRSLQSGDVWYKLRQSKKTI